MTDIVAKKRSFFNLVKAMQDYDNEIGEITDEEMDDIVKELMPTKVDDCKTFILHGDALVAGLKAEISTTQDTISSVGKSIVRFKDSMARSMESMGAQKLPGKIWNIALEYRKNIEFVPSTITTAMYVEFAMIDPNIIKREYKINRTNFKQLAEKHPEILEKYGKESVKSFVKFRGNKKGIK